MTPAAPTTPRRRGPRRLLAATAAAALAVTLAPYSPARACLHAQGPASMKIGQKGQQALILHHDGVEELVLKVEYAGDAAPSLAWIVPVPAAPTDYGTVDTALFDALDEWVQLRRERPRARAMEKSAPPQAVLTLLPPARVGPFEIQPIQVAGETGADAALNAWMREHGFQELPAATLAYYIERGWTFLAIRVTPASGAALEAEGGLPPLRVQFPSADAAYPLKLSTHMGEFAARVYLVTAAPPAERAFDGVRARGFEVVSGGRYLETARFADGPLAAAVDRFAPADAPDVLKDMLQKRFGDARALHMSVLLSERVNAPAPPDGGDVELAPARWAEDFAVSLGAAAPKVAGGPQVAPAGEPAPTSEPAARGRCAVGDAAPPGAWLLLLALLGVWRRTPRRAIT